MQIRFRIVTHPYWSPTKLIKQLRKTILKTAIPKSCLGLLFELLATTACTSYSNSLYESVRFLESQLQAERHRSAMLRQKWKDYGSPWSIQMHTFWCNSKRWRILAQNMTKLISLLILLPAWWWTLMPSGCNMCNICNRLALVACLFISLLSCLVVCLWSLQFFFCVFLVATITYFL